MINIPKSDQVPDDPNQLPPARKRRSKRTLTPLQIDERAAVVENLANRTFPSLDFFLFSLLSGIIISLGLLIGSPSVTIFGALTASLMSPVIGLSLGTVVGSARFVIRSLLGVLIGSLFVFLIGFGGGLLTQIFLETDLTFIYKHTLLSWHGFLVLALGTIITTYQIHRNNHAARIFSTALAYQFYVPIAAAGIGLGSGIPHLFPDGLVVFIIHLAWAVLLGALTLAILGYRPLTLFGYTAGGVFTIISIIMLVVFGGFGAAVGGQVALPTPVPTATFTVTPSLTPSMTITPSSTPVPPTATLPPTNTPTITPSPTTTPTPSPTPVYAIVDASNEGGDGARIRESASFSGATLIILNNGVLIEVLSDNFVQAEGATWVFVKAPDGTEGWMVEALVTVATPAPNW